MKIFLGFIPFMLLLSACKGNEVSHSEGYKEKVTLEFFTPKAETEIVFDELINEFEKENPFIEIRQVIVPNGMNVLKTRIARGDIPDLFISYPIEQDYIVRAEKGYLLDLTNEPFINRIEENIQNRYLVKGRMYGVALTQNAVGVLYNKDHFAELNLTVPETWDEFIDIMEKLKGAGKTPLLMPNNEADRSSIFNLNLVAYEFHNTYWDQQSFTIASDHKWNEISRKILKVLSYTQPNSFQDDYYVTNEKFAHGEGSMYIMGTWALPSIKMNNPKLNYGIFPFPSSNKPSENKVLGGVDIGIAIAADSQHPKEAIKFLDFLTEKENAQRLTDFEGSISTIKGVKIHRAELQALHKKILEGKSVNWPNHYWAGGTASESDFRKYTLQFYYDKNVNAYLNNLDRMFNAYKKQQKKKE